MSSIPKPITALASCLVGLALSSPAFAQTDQKADQAQVSRIVELLNNIEKALKSLIPPEKVEERLKARTPRYRTFVVKKAAAGTGTETDGSAAGSTSKPAKTEPKSRLLGDAEKKALPAGAVVVVGGMPILEKEISDLADYYGTYATVPRERLLERATLELVRVRAAQSAFKDNLAALKTKIDGLHKKAMSAGADFAAIASQHSDCPSKANGGDLDRFPRDAMVGPFAKEAFTTAVGKISPVFATHFGYHFLKVTGKEKGKTPAETQARASHVLLMYTNDQAKLAQVISGIDAGKVQIAVAAPEWRSKLPPIYR